MHDVCIYIQMKNRTQRQLAIKKIINSQEVHSQEELLMKLTEEGFELTQATLSRDLKLLKVAKVPHATEGYIYRIPEANGNTQQENNVQVNFLIDSFKSINFSGNLAVIRTRPGYASGIAAVLDNAEPYEILGTIAGDDTVLIILREGITSSDLLNSLLLIMPGLQKKIGK